MTDTALRDAVVGAGLLAGSANVIMQLSRAPVGYGVLESRVDSGNLFRHPVKRTRTTLTYLAVATMGTDAERAAYRHGVDRARAQVHSTASSPVAYNAFDTDLQLWVAACLYKGFEDVHLAFVGGEPEGFYAEAAPLGTTLQVRPEMWPVDRAAFEEYWAGGLAAVGIDDTVRRYLTRIVDLEFLPRVLAVPGRRFHRFVTTGSCRSASATKCGCPGPPPTSAGSTRCWPRSAGWCGCCRARRGGSRSPSSSPICGGGCAPDVRLFES